MVSLGCENNNFQHMLPPLGAYNRNRIKTMVTQEIEGDEIAEGIRLVEAIVRGISSDRREKVSMSKLKIGFKCGGSDAFSGITSNPLCGIIADRVAEMGGSGILTEISEMFGAESILMNRSDSEETFRKVVDLVNSFKQYYIGYNQPIYEYPSPGNKEGGITTLEEKSLGCIQKGGHAIVTDTLGYGESCVKPGINLMIGPGNDSVSITNLLAAGAMVGMHPKLEMGFFESMIHKKKERAEERKAREMAYEWLKFVDLKPNASDLAGSLSYGQQRLLEIVRGLASNP